MQEFSIIQNDAIGALALYAFVKEYCKHNNNGVTIPFIMPVLPLVYNYRSRDCLVEVKRVTLSRFLTTLSDYRDIPAGLQQRMINMSNQTFSSINHACSLNLVTYSIESGRFSSVKYQRNLPKLQYGINQDVVHAAKVLGHWFSGYTIEEICISLNIVF